MYKPEDYIHLDQNTFVPHPGDSLPTDDIVERDGYRDTKTQVEEMIYAGERLAQQRREDYDYTPEDAEKITSKHLEDDQDIGYLDDVTRKLGFDLIDAQRMQKKHKKWLEEADKILNECARAREERMAKEKAKIDEPAKSS